VAFFRGDTLMYKLLLDPAGAIRLADRLEIRSEVRDVRLAGGVLMNQESARSVAHQLRGLAGMLRAAPQVFEGLGPSERREVGSRAVERGAVERGPVEGTPVEPRTVERDPVDDDPEEAPR